jgi:hypothetical protein
VKNPKKAEFTSSDTEVQKKYMRLTNFMKKENMKILEN